MTKNLQDTSEAGKLATQKAADSLSILFNLGRKPVSDPNRGSRHLLLNAEDTDIQDNSSENE